MRKRTSIKAAGLAAAAVVAFIGLGFAFDWRLAVVMAGSLLIFAGAIGWRCWGWLYFLPAPPLVSGILLAGVWPWRPEEAGILGVIQAGLCFLACRAGRKSTRTSAPTENRPLRPNASRHAVNYRQGEQILQGRSSRANS